MVRVRGLDHWEGYSKRNLARIWPTERMHNVSLEFIDQQRVNYDPAACPKL